MPVNNTRERVAYGLTEPLLNVNPRPIIAARPPTGMDKAQLGQVWIDVPNDAVYVLTSIVDNSATWVNFAGAANITLTGDTGGPLGSSSFTIRAGSATRNSGSTVSIDRVGTTLTLDVTDGSDNTLVGYRAGNAAVTGVNNTALGAYALNTVAAGSLNTAIGIESLHTLTTGMRNVAIGVYSGSTYTGAESDNILLLSPGIVGENNTLRLGNNGSGAGQQNRAFIAGVDGVNVGSVATVVTQLNNQLGTAVLTAGSNITITPTANTITIAATGAAGVSDILGVAIHGVMSNVGATTYIAPYGSVTSTLQSAIQFQCPSAGTISKLYYRVSVNDSTANFTVKVNKNSVNTTMVTTVTALTPGTYTDLVNSFTVVAGDLIQYEISAATGFTAGEGSISVILEA